MGGIEKNRLWCQGDGNVRVRYVEGNVAAVGLFVAEPGHHGGWIGEGLPEDQASPAAVDYSVSVGLLSVVHRGLAVDALCPAELKPEAQPLLDAHRGSSRS